MEESQTIYTSIINAKRFFISMLLVIGIGTCLTIIIAIKLHSIIVIPIGIFIFWICPTLLFQKKFRNSFTRKATVKFSSDYFSVEIFNRKTEELEHTDNNRLSEIKSFKAINSTKDDSSFLKINFKNGNKAAYTFLGQGKNDSNTDITNLVVNYIHSYNSTQSESEKITLAPNLFASKAGTFYIAGLTILLIIALSLQLIYKPKTIPFTLFAGIFLYIQIIAQRKRDVRDLEDFNKKSSSLL
jgi:hypothetical protein